MELNKKITETPGIPDTVGKNSRKKTEEDSFKDSLRKSINQGDVRPENTADASDIPMNDTFMNVSFIDSGNIESQKKQSFEKSKTEALSLRVQRNEGVRKAEEVPVRRIPYAECDRIEVNIPEGYTLKVKLDERSGANPPDIYVEMKSDNGDMRACLFDASGLHKDSADAMERIAYQTVNDR